MTDDKKKIETDEEWTKKTADLRQWIEDNNSDEQYEDVIDVLEMNLKRGDKRPERRVKAWQSMLLEMRGIEGSPIGGKGAQSNLPQPVQATLKTIREALIEERQKSFGEMTKKIMYYRRSKGKGDDKITTRYFYKSALDEATSFANGRIAGLKTMYSNNEWDGTLEGLAALAEIKTDSKTTDEKESNEGETNAS